MLLSPRWLPLLLTCWALSGCSGGSDRPPPTPDRPPSPPPAPVSFAPTGPFDSAADVAGVSARAPLPPAGLPAVTEGQALRLRSTVRFSTRRVDGRRVPTLELSDEGARAALDAQLAALGARCKVELALPRFAAFSCKPRGAAVDAGDDDADTADADADTADADTADADTADAAPADGDDGAEPGGASGPAEAVLFAIEGSAVTRVELLDLFLEGAETVPLLRRLLYDPSAAEAPMVLTSTGVDARFDRHHVAHFPWRRLTPLLRPDTALAQALGAPGLVFPEAGLVFPPPGARFPEPPPLTVAIWDEDAGHLLARWRHLPAHLQPLARLVATDGPRRNALVFPPGVERVGYATAPAFFVAPLADVTLGRSTEGFDVIADGRGRRVLQTRPPGTLVTMAQGTLGHRVSGLAQRTSAFVHSGDRAGWARGPALAVAAPSDCVELTPPGEGQTAHEQGTFEDGGASYAWFLSIPAGQPRARVFSVHPVAGCSVGAALHERPIAHRAAAVHVFNSDARGGHVLVAVLDRQWPSLESTLVVYEARRPIPVLELRGRVLGLEVGATVGPDLADGYFPLKVLSGAEQTWFTWVDGGLAPVPPPPAVLPAASAR